MKRYLFILLFLVSVVLALCIFYKRPIKEVIIGIQPIGYVNPAYINEIKKQIELSYSMKVVVNPSAPVPSSAFVNIKSPRYRAEKLLNFLDSVKADTITKLVGVVEKDISFTKRNSAGLVKQPYNTYFDFGIFGLGRLPGNVCVLSTYRLKSTNRMQLNSRLRKISVHELGHTFGLKHCPTKKCVMNDANESIKTIDNAGFEICDKCRIKCSLGF